MDFLLFLPFFHSYLAANDGMRVSGEYLADLLLYALAARYVKSDVIDPVRLGNKRKIGIVAKARINAVSAVQRVLLIDYHAER